MQARLGWTRFLRRRRWRAGSGRRRRFRRRHNKSASTKPSSFCCVGFFLGSRAVLDHTHIRSGRVAHRKSFGAEKDFERAAAGRPEWGGRSVPPPPGGMHSPPGLRGLAEVVFFSRDAQKKKRMFTGDGRNCVCRPRTQPSDLAIHGPPRGLC